MVTCIVVSVVDAGNLLGSTELETRMWRCSEQLLWRMLTSLVSLLTRPVNTRSGLRLWVEERPQEREGRE